MPSFVAPFLGFALGLGFAWAAIEELNSDLSSVVGSRCMLIATLFSILVFAPMSAYFMVFHGDWSFAYLVNSERLPSAIVLAIVLVDAVSVPIGFAVGSSFAKQRKLKQLLAAASIPSLLALVAALVLSRRLGVSASYTQFHGDFGVTSISGTALGYAIVWMNGVLAASIALTVRQLRAISITAK